MDVTGEDKEGKPWQHQPNSLSNSYNPLLSFSMWFPGIKGIVFHSEGIWKGRAWGETHI